MARILLVDDDPNILDTAKDILEDAGYGVEGVETGAAARAALAAGPYDLAIIDFNLPDGKGVDLAVAIKQAHPAVVVALMTGEAQVDLGPAREAIYDCLTKPVHPPQLLSFIEKALRKRV